MSELDTKINNFLSRSTSYSEFFGLLGEYVDGVLKERDDKTKANTDLAEQNSELFLENEELKEKITEQEKLLNEIKNPLPDKRIIIDKPRKTGIIILDKEDIPDRNECYSADEVAKFFLFKTKNASYYFSKGVFRIDDDFLAIGSSVNDYFVKHNPNLEVFYRVSDLKETNYYSIQLKKGYDDILHKNECIRYKRLVRYVYFTHSALERLELELDEETLSYQRFLKYTRKQKEQNQQECKEVENKEPEQSFLKIAKDIPSYTIGTFAERYLLNKKKLKLYLKDMLKMKSNECFPAGFTLPKNFVREFEKTVNPSNEPFYPGNAFESDENLKSLARYIQRTKRFFACPYFETCYVLQSDVLTFNLKFKDAMERKVWEGNEIIRKEKQQKQPQLSQNYE